MIGLFRAKIDINKINYISEQYKLNSKDKKLIFVGIGEMPGREGANGDLLYAVIQNDFINTLFWKKSYLPKENIKHQLDVSKVFDYVDDINFQIHKGQQTTAKIENIIIIDGVRWVIDIDKKIIHKKNKPDIWMTIEQAFEIFSESTQEELLKYL